MGLRRGPGGATLLHICNGLCGPTRHVLSHFGVLRGTDSRGVFALQKRLDFLKIGAYTTPSLERSALFGGPFSRRFINDNYNTSYCIPRIHRT